METILEQMALNLPNFIFGGLAITILYRQNDRLLTMLESMCNKTTDAAISDSQEETH